MRTLLAAVASCSLLLASTARADDAEKDATIRKLIEVTGATQMGSQLVANLFEQLKPAFPHVPVEVWDELAALLPPSEAAELIVPIYAKHFEQQELEALLVFYESPAGRKLLAKMPEVMQESLEVGNDWGRRKAQELLERLKERGFEPVQA
ncbi:MAG TPA: DUF2059 domain-containing protein [Myxococcota bacterium]|nr:DUF2059 domain-containing protein [Myxococcota bacterium]